MLPTVVVGAAFLAVLPATWQSTARAVIVAHVYFNLAVVVRIVGGMWAVLPADLTGAARTLGASPWQVTRHVVLPVLRPALWAAASVDLPVHVHLVRRRRHPRRAGQPDDRGGDRPTGDAARRRRRRRGAGAAAARRAGGPRRRVHPPATTGGGRARAVAAAPRVPRRAGERRLVVVHRRGADGRRWSVPLLAMVRRSFDVGDGWSLDAWRQLGGTTRRGLSVGVDAWASLRQSLRFAVVAAAPRHGGRRARRGGDHRHPSVPGKLLDVGTMLPLGTSAVTIGFGMLLAFGRRAVRLARRVVVDPGRPGVGRHAVRRPPPRPRAARRAARPARCGGDVGRVAGARLAGGRRSGARPAARRRRRFRRGDLARRVRGDDVPHPHRPGDAADRHRQAARAAGRAHTGAGLRHGDVAPACSPAWCSSPSSRSPAHGSGRERAAPCSTCATSWCASARGPSSTACR